jgi:beta-galactosidase
MKKTPRRTRFDTDWLFLKDDAPGAEQPDFDASVWRPVDLPHDWSIEGPFSEDNPSTSRGGYLPGGVGWYRKSFTLPAGAQAKKVFIEFDGVHMNSDVWINGRPLGRYPFGYTSFCYDLTPHLRFGDALNLLAVRVDNTAQPASRWYTGAGIYRRVSLTIVDPLHVAHWGTYVTTPEVSGESARVVVKTTVENEHPDAKSCELHTVVQDKNGRAIAEATAMHETPAGDQCEFTQEFVLDNPDLWSLEAPSLHTVVSTVRDGVEATDSYVTPFGIREIRYDAKEGFFLNGKSVKKNGACQHHDLGCLGAALVDRALERQLEILRDMGCNAIRTSHNPPAPELLDLCDRMGFLVMDESFDEWTMGKSPAVFRDGKRVDRIPIHAYAQYFEEWAERDLTAMIRRDRNHPCVVLWSVGNEIPEQGNPEKLPVLQKLLDVCRREDPTRPATSACNNIQAANKSGFADRLDVAGYNYKERFYEEDHARCPDRVILGSENRTHTPFQSRGVYDLDALLTDERIKEAETSMRITKALDYCCGLYLWTGFDYIGEPTPQSWPSRSSYFGVIDLAGFPKDSYYFYQAQWTDKPVLHLLPHWNWPGREGDALPVLCYTNCESVELSLNGKSVGSRDFASTDELHLAWEVPYEPGVLKAVGKRGGQAVVETEIHTASEPAAIELSVDRETIAADGLDAAFLTARIVDKKGRAVPDADNLVTFQLQGEGKLIGVDNGDPKSHQDFKADHITAFSGLCLAVVQSTGAAGSVRLTASSPGLTDGRADIACKKPT